MKSTCTLLTVISRITPLTLAKPIYTPRTSNSQNTPRLCETNLLNVYRWRVESPRTFTHCIDIFQRSTHHTHTFINPNQIWPSPQQNFISTDLYVRSGAASKYSKGGSKIPSASARRSYPASSASRLAVPLVSRKGKLIAMAAAATARACGGVPASVPAW